MNSQPAGRTLKRLVAFLILLSAGLFLLSNYNEIKSSGKNLLIGKQAEAVSLEQPSPSPTPSSDEVMTVDQLIKESKLRIRSEKLKEPKLAHAPRQREAEAEKQTPAAEPQMEYSGGAEPGEQPLTQNEQTGETDVPGETKAEEKTEAAVAAATPSPTPEEQRLDPATLAQEDWPTQVTLRKPAQFPLFMNGKQVGALTANAGHAVRVTSLKAPLVEVEFRQSKQWIPIENTDFIIQAKAIRKKRPAAATPSPSATNSGNDVAGASAPATTGTIETSGSNGGGASPSPLAAANVLYVMPPDDPKASKTPNSFPLIAKAMEHAQELTTRGIGVKIIIAPGDYKETLTWRGPQTASGGASLLLEAERPGAVQITGLSGDEPALFLDGAAPVALRGLIIAETGGAAVRASQMTAPLLIENCVFRNNGMGLAVSGVPRVVVVSSAFVDNREGQIVQTRPDTAWDLRDSTFAALDPNNLGNVLDGVPGDTNSSIRVLRCMFYHPTLQNAFRMSDASLLGIKEWIRLVSDEGSLWSKEGSETVLANVFRRK